MENLSNQNSWVPIQFSSNSGYELEQFPEIPSNRQFYNFEAWVSSISGKLIQNRAYNRKMIFKEFRAVTQTNLLKTHPNMDEFSRNRSSSCPDILQKLNKYSQKIDGWIFQKSVQLMPRKSTDFATKNFCWIFFNRMFSR